MMGLPVISGRQWMKVVSWLGGHVKELVCEMVSNQRDKRGQPCLMVFISPEAIIPTIHPQHFMMLSLTRLRGMHIGPNEDLEQHGLGHLLELREICFDVSWKT